MPTAEEKRRMMEEWYRSQQQEPEKSPIERYYEAGPQVPTPSVIKAPTPAIIEYQRAERGRTPIEQYYSAGRGVTTPPIREYYYTGRQLPAVRQPATPGRFYETVSNIPRRWISPTPGVYSGGPPTAPYSEDIYNTWLDISAESAMREMYYRGPEWFRRGANLARNILGAVGIGREEPQRPGLSVDWAGLWQNYVDIYKRHYQGPTFDFAVSGPTEDLYEPGDYVPGYEVAEAPTYTIRYGGGGTPSGQRNYAANLINWRV